MSKGIAFLPIILSMIIAGCAEEPIPQVSISKHFPSMDKNAVVRKNDTHFAWWKQLRSPELDQLIADGFKHNPDIPIAMAKLEQAHGELQQIKLSFIPLINIYGGYSTNPALGVPGGFYGIWPYYTLNLLQLPLRQKKSQYNLDYYATQVDGVRLLMISQITSAYLTLIAEKEQLRLLNQLAADVRRLIQLSRKDIAIGLDNKMDVAKLEVSEQLIKAQIKPVEHNITASQNALRFLVFLNPGKVNTSRLFRDIDLKSFKPGALPAEVLNHRPDVRMAELAVKRDAVGVSVAYSNFFPKLQLDEFIGNAHLPENTFEQATDAYLQATLAPSNFGLIQAKKGAYQTSVAKYVKTIRRVLQDVDTQFSAHLRIKEEYIANCDAKKNYLYKYTLQKGLYHDGLLSYKELLSNKIYLDELALTTNQAKLKLAMSLVKLYQELAVGYEANDNNRYQKVNT